ncbi:MAG: hypothetical protein KGJ60_09650, partial [Verrucomicrobiota bacterium]|nr:hypothetical protein [Verrucomicrobiota bacterium]
MNFVKPSTLLLTVFRVRPPSARPSPRGRQNEGGFPAFPFLIACVFFLLLPARAESIFIVAPSNAAPRVVFGAERLAAALKAVGTDAKIIRSGETPGRRIWITLLPPPGIADEGFTLKHQTADEDFTILGDDDSGALYGCLELARRIRAADGLPDKLYFHDAPVMRLRGTCVGMQKTRILPGRRVYEYPYMPALFPWFYDKQMWTEYLDFLVGNRFNTLYLWSGHPFASLVRLKKYPEAVEVPDDVFR